MLCLQILLTVQHSAVHELRQVTHCSLHSARHVHIQICTNRWITALTEHAFRIIYLLYLSLIRWHEARCIYNLFKQDGLEPVRAYAKRFASEMMRNIVFSHR